jgi:hypothetical protein
MSNKVRFHECLDAYNERSEGADGLTWDEFFTKTIERADSQKGDPEKGSLLSNISVICTSQAFWREQKRPFFNLYPETLKMIESSCIDIQISQVNFVIPSVCISFPVGLSFNGIVPKNVFLCKSGKFISMIPRYSLQEENEKKTGYKSLFLAASLGESDNAETCLSDRNYMVGQSPGFWRFFVKVAIGTMILASQPEMIERVLLSKDVLKGRHGPDAERRALQRGINGWSIGKNLEGQSHEVSGHIRRPHFAIRWTEKGRKTPRLVPVKGSVVNRSKLTTVPTGYLDKTESKTEPTQ